MEEKHAKYIGNCAVCRICTSSYNCTYNVFVNTLSDGTILASAIMECAPIIVSPDDGLPSFICINCVTQLEMFTCFRKRCVESDRLFKIHGELDFKVDDEYVLFQSGSSDPLEFVKAEICDTSDDDAACDFGAGAYQSQIETLSDARAKSDSYKDERPYVCETCVKTFKKRTHLEIHRRTHTGERPYKCEICDRGFAVKKTLTLHVRTHSTEKPFECTICLKRFRRKDYLKDHAKLHEHGKRISKNLSYYNACVGYEPV